MLCLTGDICEASAPRRTAITISNIVDCLLCRRRKQTKTRLTRKFGPQIAAMPTSPYSWCAMTGKVCVHCSLHSDPGYECRYICNAGAILPAF